MSELEGKAVKEYWDKRAGEQGERTVGFGFKSLDEQDKNYESRREFIVSKIFPYLKCNVLDYGCGIGRYSNIFDKDKYCGVDVCDKLLDIAKGKNPEYCYNHIPSGTMNDVSFDRLFNVVFFATVLQHNSDVQVINILESLKPYMTSEFVIVLYENSHNAKDSHHMSFRQPSDYINLIKSVYNIYNPVFYDHIIHKERHSILSVKCS